MPQLVEREHALQALRAALALARAGSGRTALVCGDAGIGKTSLVTRFTGEQRDALRVLWGGCEALFSPRPLGPLYDMAQHFSARLQALLGQEGQRAQLFNAVLDELARAGATGVMVLEDLHWADAATLDFAKFLARRVQRLPLLLVLTYRDDELGQRHPLRAVLGDLPASSVVRLPLLPLTEAGVAELAGQASRTATGLFALTSGNPFFLTEALADGANTAALPANVRDAVLARAARLAPAVRDLLDLAAMVPGRIEASLVQAVLGPQPEDVAAALSSGLLSADQHFYAFRHELARLSIAGALHAVQAAALHARLLACLEQDRESYPAARLY